MSYKKILFNNIEILLESEILGARSLYEEIGKLVKQQLDLPLEEEYDKEYKAYELLLKRLRKEFNNISSSAIIISLINTELESEPIYDISKIKISKMLHEKIHEFNLNLLDIRKLYSIDGLEKIVAIQEYTLGFTIDESLTDINEIIIDE